MAVACSISLGRTLIHEGTYRRMFARAELPSAVGAQVDRVLNSKRKSSCVVKAQREQLIFLYSTNSWILVERRVNRIEKYLNNRLNLNRHYIIVCAKSENSTTTLLYCQHLVSSKWKCPQKSISVDLHQ